MSTTRTEARRRAPVRTRPRLAPSRARSLALAASLLGLPGALQAQHEHHPPAADTVRADTARADSGRADAAHGEHLTPRPLGIPYERMGSGTSWVPDAAPMWALHRSPGEWMLMLHGVAYLAWNDQRGPRGDSQLSLIDWEMLMAMRPLAGGILHLHAMTSLEPFVLGGRGYPLLLQTGERWRGEPLHDRQHPHDLVMEAAAMYERIIAPGLAATVYVAPVGEPAAGPVAYMHRPSSDGDPFAPLGHHWQDATHITYGVVTAGLGTRRVKVEGSLFNGREPDENRTDFDWEGAPLLDSWSARVNVNPSPRWSLAASWAHLGGPEPEEPDESVRRLGASVQYARPLARGGEAAATLLVGSNRHEGADHEEPSVLAEGTVTLLRGTTLYARAEWLRKSGEDLVLAPSLEEGEYEIRSLAVGLVRELATAGGFTLGIGGRGSVALLPRALEETYGSRTPTGVAVYLRLRPRRMAAMGGTAH
jgi:hypothetical protein